jgi:hypothetical protein
MSRVWFFYVYTRINILPMTNIYTIFLYIALMNICHVFFNLSSMKINSSIVYKNYLWMHMSLIFSWFMNKFVLLKLLSHVYFMFKCSFCPLFYQICNFSYLILKNWDIFFLESKKLRHLIPFLFVFNLMIWHIYHSNVAAKSYLNSFLNIKF